MTDQNMSIPSTTAQPLSTMVSPTSAANASPQPAFSSPRQPKTTLPSQPQFPAIAALTTPNSPLKSLKRPLSPRPEPIPLTGAAAMADNARESERKKVQLTSVNAPVSAVKALSGQSSLTSSPADAPGLLKTTITPAHPAATTPAPPPTINTNPDANNVFASQHPEQITSENTQTSPISMSGSETAGLPTSASTNAKDNSLPSTSRTESITEERSNKALTYPPQVTPQEAATPSPARGMSLPGSGRSPSSATKKHKCPHCNTEFTRHHNLKSHLLTHSQEKPFGCQQCSSRFRRLHDLKRHLKLHTGERPHICDKCGRKFARGDALARHSKGPGQCAGRRSSTGGGADGDYDDSEVNGSMEGVIYNGSAAVDDTSFAEASNRRKSEPQRPHRASANPNLHSSPEPIRQHSSTYPPVAPMHRGSTSSLYPPGATSQGPGSPYDPSNRHLSPKAADRGSYTSQINSNNQGSSASNVFSQGGMTESPRPLSPGQIDPHRRSSDASVFHRGRSPSLSLSSQLQQQKFGRGSTAGHPATPPVNLPPPMISSQHANSPQLPPLPSMHLHQPGMKAPAPPMISTSQHSGPAASHPASASSHGQSSGSSMREILNQPGSGQPGDTTTAEHIRQIERDLTDRFEERFHRLQEESEERLRRQQDGYEAQIARLKNEIDALRSAAITSTQRATPVAAMSSNIQSYPSQGVAAGGALAGARAAAAELQNSDGAK